MNIILVGPRGVGKSKVARKLSKLSGKVLVSTDMIAVYELGGISIPDFIDSKGGDWVKFRELEYSILQKLKDSKGIILDCGGGILFDLDNNGKEIFSERKYNLLRSIGKIVSLNRNKEYLISKVKEDSTRPSLSNQESYSDILDRRKEYYKKSADIYLQIDGMEPEDIAKVISSSLEND
ncbi:MAG: shikimate kinase [Leptospiraceae bacterium]|nr:shikimate kinase [Leptospiraceae bacterium]